VAKRDMTSLPKAQETNPDAWLPDTDPVFKQPLTDWLYAQREEREPKSREYIRPSDVLKCARALSYSTAGVESPPPAPASLIAFAIGDAVEAMLEGAVRAAFTNEEGDLVGIEFQIDMEGELTIPTKDGDVEVSISGRADAVTDEDVLDWKSVGSYPWKMMRGARGNPEGPKLGAVLQTAMGALWLKRDKVRVVYLAKEALSVTEAKKLGLDADSIDRVYGEYSAPLEPLLEELHAEMYRMWRVVRLVHDHGTAAARKIPGVPGPVHDPMTGTWFRKAVNDDGDLVIVDQGSTWHCDYCDFRGRCIEDGPITIRPRPEATA
jgi:hypothetical protein